MSVPGGSNPLLLATAAGAGGGYEISRSLRFNSSDSAYLSRTPSTAGNRKTWTWAGWVKRSALGAINTLFFAGTSSTNLDLIRFDASDRLDILWFYGGVTANIITTPVYRDPSAWMHVVVSVDTTQATASNRIKVYINGSQVTTLTTATYPTQNTDSLTNATNAHNIGRDGGNVNFYLNGYLADIHFIDGQALDPSSFTEVSATTGQLIPKAYTGSFGTNGFWLKFSDNSAATATTLGKDYSGNSNNWTPNNFAVGSNPVYSNGLTTNGSKTGWFGGTPAQAFDSSTTTFVQGALGGDVTFTPASPIPVATQLRIWADSGSGSGVGSSGYQIIYNGTTIYNQSAMWTSPYTISAAPGTSLSSLVIDTSAGGEAMRLFAVEVDGVILVDGAGAGNDSLVDTPISYGTGNSGGDVRGNYCTLNPLSTTAGTFTQGNLRYTGPSNWYRTNSTVSVSTGKWYWEVTLAGNPNSQANNGHWHAFGFGLSTVYASTTNPSSVTDAVVMGDSGWYKNFSAAWTNASGTFTSGSVLSVAVDLDANTFEFRHNNTSLATGTIGGTAGRELTPVIISYDPNYGVMDCNFGARSFAYSPPSGFKALCDTNLPAPVVAKPNEVMDVKLYTGNGSTQTISGLNFSPDFVWVKARSSAISHFLYDTVRGFSNGNALELRSNGTNAEAVPSTASTGLTAFNSDGFSLGSDGGANTSSATYVGWTWDAGSTTVTNTQGSITSQVRANASAGFSVVTYTGTGSNATVGHGLGVAPALIIVKCRDSASNWTIYHASVGAGARLIFTTAASDSSSTYWNDTTPTSSVFSISTSGGVNTTSVGYVAYCFAPVAGYSSFGSYVGNGSSDGPFVYTGFRPRWVMVKVSSASGFDWLLFDSARDTYNAAQLNLRPNLSIAESSQSANLIDFLSNGFKLRGNSDGSVNPSQTLIYAAFAESPFQYARAR